MSAAAPTTAGTEASPGPDAAAASQPSALDSKASRHSLWLFHGIWLVLPALAIGLSLVLTIRDAREVLVPVINQPLPELCSFRRMTGLECAGCGLTRSFISIGHGQFADAWQYHPAGLLLYAIAAFQIPWRSVQLWRLSRGWGEVRLGGSVNGVYYVLAILLLGVWIFRLWGRVFGI